MHFEDGRESSNVEDRRSEGGGGFGGSRLSLGGRSISAGTIVIALVAMYFGVDPSVVLNGGGITLPDTAPHLSAPAKPGKQEQELSRFVSMVLADTEDTWHAIFKERNRRYEEPKLVLFSGATRTACGKGESAMGPFYCPLDKKVYIDLSFYNTLQRRFKAPGDSAQAYVIAHEVGHHVQNLLGLSDKVHQLRSQASEAESNALSVRLELQADCFAGIWAHHADKSRQVFEAGDIEEALAAATAIGDDTLQKSGQGYVVPESFTHGSAAQRVRWFKQGLKSGRTEACNTFKTSSL